MRSLHALACRTLFDPSRRRWIGWAGLVASGAWVVGCGEPASLRIGFIGGLSGRVSDLGIGGRNGTQLAVDDCNAAGGFNGRAIELLTRDDEQNVDTARKRLAELYDARVVFVVGPMTSSIAVELVPLADARGIPLISPTSTTHELSGKADAFFRVVPDAPSGAVQQADALLSRGLRRLVIVSDLSNRAFSESWTQAAAQRFIAKHGEVALTLAFRSAPGVSYADLARQVAAARGDVVIMAVNASDTALLAQQIRRLDNRIALATSPWAGTEQLPQMGGRALEGLQVTQYFDRGSTATAYLGFVQRYVKRFGEPPGYPAVNGYDALMLGLEGLRRQGNGTLLQSLGRLRMHTGLQRSVEINAQGDSRAPMFLTEIRAGQYGPSSE